MTGGGAGAKSAPAEPAAGGPEDLGPEDPLPLPDNVKDEDREMFILAGEMIRSLFRSGHLKPPPLVPPQT
jgi:hypothetical protein